MKKEILVKMDDREGAMDLIAMSSDEGVGFIAKRLKVGDYQYKNIIIERKEISDFCSSILDGRLNRQVENMKKEELYGKECFIIVVGSIKDRTADIHENCILGKMVSLVIKDGMRLLFCDDDFQFVYLLKNIIEKIGDKDEV